MKPEFARRLAEGVAAGALVFRYDDLGRELTALARVAEPYLDPASVGRLTALVRQLDEFASWSTQPVVRWSTRDVGEITTLENSGRHQAARTGHGFNLVARIGFDWELQNWGPKKNKSTPFTYCLVSGLAIVRVYFDNRRDDGDRPIAMWSCELGDPASPGCHFHTQVLGDPYLAPAPNYFPRGLDVPRIPNLLFTPADAIDFVLGELFQKEWLEHLTKGGPDADSWRSLQQARLTALLNWQGQKVKDAAASPWNHLKAQKPHALLFVEGA